MSIYNSVSIVIPMRNESKHIKKCLDSLLDQDWIDSKIEIILEIVQADFVIIIFIQLNKYKDDKYLSPLLSDSL